MKNTWASTLSAHGAVRLNARAREIGVLPIVGARMVAAIASAAKAPMVVMSCRRRSVRAGKGHHVEMTGARVHHDVRVDAVEGADARGRQHIAGWSHGHHASGLEQH